MNPPPRFHVLAPLSPIEGWDRSLALDRQGGVPRPVVLSYAPAALAEDAARLAALSRDAEAAARVSDPHLVQVLGLEPVGERLALVERHQPGTSLRSLLQEAGRLPADLAARAVVDACLGLAALHALDPADGEAVAHGGITPERLLVGGDGLTRVSGLAVHGGRDPLADVHALAAVLHETLAGEAPAEPPRPIDAPGVPPALAVVVDLALGAAPGGPFPTASSLAEAIAAALPPAPGGALAAYAEAVAPPRERPSSSNAPAEPLPEVSAELIAPVPAPGPAPAPAPAPVTIPAPVPAPKPEPELPRVAVSPDAATTFPAPAPAARGNRAPIVVALVTCALGFGVGFALERLRAPPAPPAAPAPQLAAAAPQPIVAAPQPAAVEPPPPAVVPAPAPAPRPAPHAKTAVAPPSGARPVPVRKLGQGWLDVTAPTDAEVRVDGRLVGKGSLKVQVAEGRHRIEVRLGQAKVQERFEVAPGETWTYNVTPTP